jgi:general stress protein 26
MKHLALLPLLWGAPLGAAPSREVLLKAARALMLAQRYCALITQDSAGRPSVRTMNPLAPEADMTVWFATDDRSRKVQELMKDPKVTIYYANHAQAEGYVALHGQATLTRDAEDIQRRKRAYWDQAFPGMKHLLLIKVVPERVEIISYKDNLKADPDSGQAPSVSFPASLPPKPIGSLTTP